MEISILGDAIKINLVGLRWDIPHLGLKMPGLEHAIGIHISLRVSFEGESL
jgi:hypothetical protein